MPFLFFYTSKSPSLIKLKCLKIKSTIYTKQTGEIISKPKIPTYVCQVFPIDVNVPICPTNPAVPIPALETIQISFKKHVDIGTKIALTIIVGNQMIVFLNVFKF